MVAGLLADRPGVPIGAMVVACWILLLQAMAFEMIWGELSMGLLLSLQAPGLGTAVDLIGPEATLEELAEAAKGNSYRSTWSLHGRS